MTWNKKPLILPDTSCVRQATTPSTVRINSLNKVFLLYFYFTFWSELVHFKIIHLLLSSYNVHIFPFYSVINFVIPNSNDMCINDGLQIIMGLNDLAIQLCRTWSYCLVCWDIWFFFRFLHFNEITRVVTENFVLLEM